MIKGKNFEEKCAFVISDVLISYLMLNMCSNVYISNINLFIEAKTIGLVTWGLNIVLYFFLINTQIKLYQKIYILSLPLNLYFVLMLLSINYYIGLIFVVIMILVIICYFLVLIFKKKKINRMFFSKALIMSVFLTSLSGIIIPISKNISYSAKNNITINPQRDFSNDKMILNYEKLEIEDKLKLLSNYVLNKEAAYLGIKDIPTLKASNMEGLILGEYDYNSNVINLNIKYVKERSLEETIKTLLHEMKHCEQRLLMKRVSKINVDDLKSLEYIRNIKNSFRNYNGVKDLEKYENSFIEFDANQHSELRMVFYKEELKSIGRK
jgi:hypothetical protein